MIIYGLYEILSYTFDPPALVDVYKNKQDAQKKARDLQESMEGSYYTYVVKELEVK